VIERGDDKFRFFLVGKGVPMGEFGTPYPGTRSQTKKRTSNFIAFVTTQIDLMNRAAGPVTKDEIVEAYRKKRPERVSKAFKVHFVVFVLVILALLVVGGWIFLLLAGMWGLFLLYHFETMRTAYIV